MKGKIKVLSAMVLMAAAFCAVAPRIAQAGQFTSEDAAFFVGDSWVSSSRQSGIVWTGIYDCDWNKSTPYVKVLTNMYYRKISTGNGGSYEQKSASGYTDDLSVYWTPPADHEISLVSAVHNATWNGVKQTVFSRSDQ